MVIGQHDVGILNAPTVTSNVFEIAISRNKKLSAGDQKFQINLDTVTDKSYMLKISINDTIITRNLMILKP